MKERTEVSTADLSAWTAGRGFLHEKTNHPISEQAGIQSLYCQDPLPVASPLHTYRKTPNLGVSWGGEAECRETSVFCPLAWAAPTGRVHGEGRLITPPAEDVTLAGMHGG